MNAAEQLNPEQLQALQDFARDMGRNWKHILRAKWEGGTDTQMPNGPLLRQVRNTIGPSGLQQLRIDYRVPSSYRGWKITTHAHPQTGKYRGERIGVEQHAGTLEGLMRTIDGYIDQYPEYGRPTVTPAAGASA